MKSWERGPHSRGTVGMGYNVDVGISIFHFRREDYDNATFSCRRQLRHQLLNMVAARSFALLYTVTIIYFVCHCTLHQINSR